MSTRLFSYFLNSLYGFWILFIHRVFSKVVSNRLGFRVRELSLVWSYLIRLSSIFSVIRNYE